MKLRHLPAIVLGLCTAVPAFAANIVLNNVDAPGVGFNDPTPATPVGGNMGTTVGAQRLIAYQRALQLWGRTLKSKATIVVQGSFAGLPCDVSSGVLAQAGALQIFSDFPGAKLPGHWYGVALANALAGEDLTPGPPDPGPLAEPFNDDIVANFNGNIGTATCLPGPGWYYGLDSTPGPGQTDFLDVFMHEVSHGLGFQNFVSESSGASPEGLPDVYMANTLDLNLGKTWNQLTSAEIRASAINTGRVVWTGRHVTGNAPLVLAPFEGLRVFGGLQRELAFGTAAFGPAPTVANLAGAIALIDDGVAAAGGGTPTDGCEPITTSLAGKVALLDRGLCGFVVKVKNAQNAGASAVIVANTLGRAEFGMAGTDPTITIPSVGVSQADGDAIKAALATTAVGAEYFVDATRRAGTTGGFVRLYAPSVVEPGSTISHFDVTATPNLLMEPFITPTLRGSTSLDLTASLMRDIGWRLETLKIGRCDTDVRSVLRTGEMMHASVDACAAGARNDRQFKSCVKDFTKDAKKRGLLSGQERSRILRCINEHDRDDDHDDGHAHGHLPD